MKVHAAERFCCHFCVIVALFIGVAAMPAAGAFYSVNTSIHQGATVFIGEQGLDLTPAIMAYPNTTAGRPIYIGWWASAAQIGTTSPIATVTLTNPTNTLISYAAFGSYYGNWYAINASGVVNQSAVFMIVRDPQISINIWDYSQGSQGGISVSGKPVVQGDILGFKVGTNMDMAISQPTRRTKTVANEVTGWADIKVKTEQGNTFNKLIASDGTAIELTGQSINTPTWYWAGNAAGLAGNWSTSATDSTGQFAYPVGTYVVVVESKMNGMLDNYLNAGAAYTGKTVSQAQTVTLVSNTVKISANKYSVVRSKPFSVTITGNPNTMYHLWIKDTSTMTGDYGNQPPMISKYQAGVRLDAFAGTGITQGTLGCEPYLTAYVSGKVGNAGGYIFQNSGSTDRNNPYVGSIWADVAHGGNPGTTSTTDIERMVKLGNGTYLYANVSLADTGTRTVEFTTSNWTKTRQYPIRVEQNMSGSYKSDEVDVRVERGAATIVAAGDQNYYLGEEIKFSGTNTETQTTYLFITGPNLPQYGAQINRPNPQNAPVVNNDPTTFQQARVLADTTWSWKWRTSNVTLDAGTYTVWAASEPSNAQAQNLSQCVYGTVSIVIKKPFITANVSKSTILQGDRLFITGVAGGEPSEGVQIWIIGDSYGVVYTESVNSDETFSYEITSQTTANLNTGQYFVIAQHPMQDNQFDIYLNPSDGFVYNSKLGSLPGTPVFRFSGAGSIRGAEAAGALIDALNNSIVDDTYVNLTFTIQNESPPIDPDYPPQVSLSRGWNFISTPKKLSTGNNTAAIFSSIDTAGHSIYLYNASERVWYPLTLTDKVQPLDGIWIYANKTEKVNLSFDTNPMQIPPTKSLSAGWNAIGFSDTTSISASTTLNSVKARWSTLIGFNPHQQRYEYSIVNGATDPLHGDHLNMYPGKGYWLYMTEAGELAAIGA